MLVGVVPVQYNVTEHLLLQWLILLLGHYFVKSKLFSV